MGNSNGSRSLWEIFKLPKRIFSKDINYLAALSGIVGTLIAIIGMLPSLWTWLWTEQNLQPLLFQVQYLYRPTSESEFQLLKEDSLLRSGDNYKILFTVGQDNSYVYIFQIDSKNIDRLFPLQNFQGAKEQANPVRSGKTYFLPDEHKAFVLNHNIGQEKIYFVYFPEPDITLENLYSDYLQARQQQYTDQIVERQNNLLKKLQQVPPASISVLTFSHLN